MGSEILELWGWYNGVNRLPNIFNMLLDKGYDIAESHYYVQIFFPMWINYGIPNSIYINELKQAYTHVAFMPYKK